MPLNIFQNEDEAPVTNKFANDTVGTFRAGRLSADGTPESLSTWRVTTGDPEVADAIAKLFNAEDSPSEWDTQGEEIYEVYTPAKQVFIILEDADAVRQEFVFRTRDGELVYKSDGAVITYGEDEGQPDPDAHRTLDERLERGNKGIGPKLETSIRFRLEDINGQPIPASDLGLFRFRSTGKSIGKAVLKDQIERRLAEFDCPVRAKLSIEHVSYIAKQGRMAGQTVSYNTAALKLLGPAR